MLLGAQPGEDVIPSRVARPSWPLVSLGRSQRHVLDTRGRHHSLLAAHSPTVINAQYRADRPPTPPSNESKPSAWPGPMPRPVREHEYTMTAKQREERQRA